MADRVLPVSGRPSDQDIERSRGERVRQVVEEVERRVAADRARDLPAEQARREVLTRKHPIRQALDACASGAPLDDELVDELVARAPEDLRWRTAAKLRKAGETCRELFTSGAHAPARDHSRAESLELAAVVGPEPPPRLDLSHKDPREAADLIFPRSRP